MTTLKRMTVIATMLVCGAISGSADDFWFNVTNGTWNDPDNWWPPGVPGSDDKATILNTQTCRIENANQSIRTLTINTGGLLKIKGKDLTMAGDDEPLYRLTVEGSLDFEIANTVTPRLILEDNLGIDGDGTISASGSGKQGEIVPYDCTLSIADPGEPINERVTMKGSILFHVNIDNEGHVLVDAGTDEMEIGYLDSGAQVVNVGGEEGDFKVTAGTMLFGKTAKTLGLACVWDVAGGTLELTKFAQSNWLSAEHLVKVSSGTLLLNYFFVTYGGLEFSGGTIRVAKNKIVSFFKEEE